MGLSPGPVPSALPPAHGPIRPALACTPALALVLGLLAAVPAAAQSSASLAPPRNLAPPIGFHVLVAHASEEAGETDPECKIMEKRLPMHFGSIRSVHSRDYWTGFGDLVKIELPGADAPVQLRPMAIHERQLFMQFQLPGRMDSRLRVSSGRPVILGGVPHPDGGFLIIQVEPDFGRYLDDPNGTTPGRSPGVPNSVRVNATGGAER